MHKRYIPLTLGLLLALTACGPKAPQVTPTPEPAPVVTPSPTPSPAPELQWTDQVFEQSFPADDGTTVMTVRYVFPDIIGAAANEAWDKIHTYYANEGAAYLTSATENADLALDDYHIAQASGYDFIPYADEFSYKITRQTGELASIKRNYYSNMGGAYPVSYQFCETFDLSTGDKLGLDGLLATGWRETVLDLLAAQADAAQLGLDAETLAGVFDPSCFYLTQDALVVYFQEGVLGGHGLGLVELPIPLSDLSGLLLWSV